MRRFTELAAAFSRKCGLDGASVPDCYNTSNKPSKATIQDELREARAEIDHLTNLRLSEALTSAIELQMTDSQRALVATVEHLKAEVERLQVRNGELSKQLRNMMMAVDNIKSK